MATIQGLLMAIKQEVSRLKDVLPGLDLTLEGRRQVIQVANGLEQRAEVLAERGPEFLEVLQETLRTVRAIETAIRKSLEDADLMAESLKKAARDVTWLAISTQHLLPKAKPASAAPTTVWFEQSSNMRIKN